MFVRITKWECRRLVDILRTRKVDDEYSSWADDFAVKIENAMAKELSRQESAEGR